MDTKEREVDELVDVADFVWPLLERWKLLLITALLGAAIAFGVTRFAMPKVYRSTATIFVKQSRTGSDLLRALPISLPGADGSNSGYLVTLLQSETLLREVISDLDLAKRREFARGKPKLSMEKAVEKLKRSVEVRDGKSGSISVSVSATDPYLAAEIANRMLDVLNTMVVTTSNQKTEFISGKLEETSRDLRRAEDELESFQERHDVAAIDEETRGLVSRLTELDGKLLVNDVELQQVSSDLDNAGELNNLVDQQVRKRALEAGRRYIMESRAQLHARLQELPAVSASYGRLMRKIGVLTKTYELLTEQYQMAQITQQGEDGNYQVIDRARPKTRKVAPRTAVNMVAGAALGCLLASVGVWQRRFLPKQKRSGRVA